MSGFFEPGDEGDAVLSPGGQIVPLPRRQTDVARVAGEPDDVLEVRRDLPPEEWKPIFLRIFAATGNHSAACQAAGINRSTMRRHLEEDADFKQKYDDSREEAIESLELAAWNRARNGSDFLLWRLMQSLKPEVYGERRTIEHKFTQSERREAYRLAKEEGLSDSEAREAVAAAEEMLRQARGRGS